MDIETIKQLQQNGAAIALMLKEVSIRGQRSEWHLLAMFEVLDRIGKRPVPATITITSSKFRHLVINKCEVAGVSFAEFPLAGTVGTRAKASGPARSQCQRSCNLCTKTDFDSASGCHNSSVFSPAVGDWVCNLVASFQGRQ